MIARLSLVVLSILVLSPALSYAQTEARNPIRASAPESDQGTVAAGPDAMKMYEDIEIFRRILDRKLNTYYPRITLQSTGGMAGMQGGMMGMQGGMIGMQGGMQGMQPMIGQSPPLALYSSNATWVQQETSRTLEGVYLEGQGIIYTATLASLQPRGKAEAAPPPPVDEWESIRRQLRNEKEEPRKAEASKPPELSDVVLKMLAEYGHHFSQLHDNESLILILTVRDARSSAVKTAKKAELNPADAQKVRDLERVADLHQKQGQYSEAITNYLKLVELNLGTKQEAALHRKLAQCYLSLAQDEKARTELDAAQALLKKEKDDKDKPAAKPAAAALPGKLMISVPKRLLDQAVTGKMPFDEFRRRANVRKLTFDERRP
jgi:tetratricopeptide (TPR) repeat protein